MLGACTTIGGAGSFYPPPGNSHSHRSSETNPAPRKPLEAARSGALASARQVLRRLLGGSGFLDPTAPFVENFSAQIHYQPMMIEQQDLDPGALKTVLAMAKGQMAGDPAEALHVQARVSPPAALRLLRK